MSIISRQTSVSIFLLIPLALFGCLGDGAEPMTEDQRHEIERTVEARTWEFHAADTSRSAENVVDLLWPEFTLLADGARSTYSDVATGSVAFMSEVEIFETVWTELEVIALSSTSAISSFIFKDRIVMKSGEVVESWGPNTFVWLKRSAEWRIIHTDADHYPLSGG
ncbi:MAG: hypothetical protein HKN43_03900 [Rhodothermales bacterium]|nr:hypothetical protein [Rhodothermales bacterium]